MVIFWGVRSAELPDETREQLRAFIGLALTAHWGSYGEMKKACGRRSGVRSQMVGQSGGFFWRVTEKG